MVVFTERNLRDTAVYWGNPQSDGYGGYTYDEPVELRCRWERTNMIIASALDIQMEVRHEVQLAQDVDEEGMMMQGTIDDIDSDLLDDPNRVPGAEKIVRFDKIPNLQGTAFYRKVYLGRPWAGKL